LISMIKNSLIQYYIEREFNVKARVGRGYGV
jgi:hypothetical protein